MNSLGTLLLFSTLALFFLSSLSGKLAARQQLASLCEATYPPKCTFSSSNPAGSASVTAQNKTKWTWWALLKEIVAHVLSWGFWSEFMGFLADFRCKVDIGWKGLMPSAGNWWKWVVWMRMKVCTRLSFGMCLFGFGWNSPCCMAAWSADIIQRLHHEHRLSERGYGDSHGKSGLGEVLSSKVASWGPSQLYLLLLFCLWHQEGCARVWVEKYLKNLTSYNLSEMICQAMLHKLLFDWHITWKCPRL